MLINLLKLVMSMNLKMHNHSAMHVVFCSRLKASGLLLNQYSVDIHYIHVTKPPLWHLLTSSATRYKSPAVVRKYMTI